jgi:hypothetical protein
VRFTGLVIGITALGTVLYGRVALSVTEALPNVSSIDWLALVHDITAESFPGMAFPAMRSQGLKNWLSPVLPTAITLYS